LVSKLGQGDRVPSQCKLWDVRAKYAKEKINLRATYIQDVGRVCGHKDVLADVLIGSSQGVCFKAEHRNLNSNGAPTYFHPEHAQNSGVFSKLSRLNYLVLLDCAPQLGKTGMILSLWALIAYRYSKADINPKSPWVPKEIMSRAARTLQLETRRLIDIASNNGIPALLAEMNKGDTFEFYHNMCDQFNLTMIKNKDLPYNLVIDAVESAPNWRTFVDCGCGKMGLVYHLRLHYNAMNFPKDTTFTVFGQDLHKSIERLVTHSWNPESSNWDPLSQNCRVKFVPQVCEQGMAVVELTEPVDVICFSLSLFDVQATRHINWAAKHLKTGGMLFIADLAVRLDGCEDGLKAAGWRTRSFRLGVLMALKCYKTEGTISVKDFLLK